jgi:hypothetical protein
MVTVDRCGGVGASFIIIFTFVLGAVTVAVAASMTMSFVFFSRRKMELCVFVCSSLVIFLSVMEALRSSRHLSHFGE